MTVEQAVNQFGFGVGILIAIVGTLLYVLRSRTDAHSHAEKTGSDTEKAYADALLLLARNGESTNRFLGEMVSTSRETAAELRGMIAMLDSNTKATRANALSLDDLSGQMPAIKTGLLEIKTATTDLGGTINDQFGPVVDELKSIGIQLKGLAGDVLVKDDKINANLTVLLQRFERAERWLMQKLEPLVLAHMQDLLPPDKPDTPLTEANHKEATKETQSS